MHFLPASQISKTRYLGWLKKKLVFPWSLSTLHVLPEFLLLSWLTNALIAQRPHLVTTNLPGSKAVLVESGWATGALQRLVFTSALLSLSSIFPNGYFEWYSYYQSQDLGSAWLARVKHHVWFFKQVLNSLESLVLTFYLLTSKDNRFCLMVFIYTSGIFSSFLSFK